MIVLHMNVLNPWRIQNWIIYHKFKDKQVGEET